jgi:sugar lactone lactonase YvrE
LAVDANGNLYIADSANNRVRFVNAAAGVITTIAGTDSASNSGDGGAATSAGLNPVGLALDAAGNLFISDSSNSSIRRVDAGTGNISTVAGFVAGYFGDGGPATAGALSNPRLLTVDQTGNLYVPEAGNNVIRKIAGGILSTFAGVFPGGFGGDGGPASAALLNRPYSIAFDPAGNLVIVDSFNNRVRRVNALTGNISTIAGTGNTITSGDGGQATAASFNSPYGVAVDGSGNIFVSEQSGRVRRIDATTGVITTVAGGGGCCVPDGAPATTATLYQPSGISLDSAGNLIIANTGANNVRLVDFSSPQISFSALSAQVGSSAGSGSLAVTVTAGGPLWMATSSASWLTLTGPNGSGSGAISYSYTANASALPRSAAISAYGQNFVITQAGAVATLSASSATAPSTAGTGSVTLTLSSPASWTAASSATWLTVSPASGSAGTTLTYSFAANTSTAARTALLIIAGKQFALTQVGSSGNSTPWGLSSYGVIRTIAGNGASTSAGDGGLATVASVNVGYVNLPPAVTTDANGNVFFTEYLSRRVRRIDAVTQIITTVAGNGTQAYSGDGGPATSASLYDPEGVAVDAAGNIYISDATYGVIRKVDHVTGNISTYAGNGSICCYVNNVPAASAFLNGPTGLAFDPAGNLYVAEHNGNLVQKIDANTGIISTYAGNLVNLTLNDGQPATSAGLSAPAALAFDAAGNLFIADSNHYRIRRVDGTTGIITTVAGNGTSAMVDGSQATASGIAPPSGLAVDPGGNVFISGASSIRRIDAVTGIITTVAGGASQGFSGDGGPATAASLNITGGLVADPNGNIYVVDSNNYRIRFIDYSSPRAVLASSSATVAAASGTGSVSFTLSTATASWTATSSASWLTVSPASGNGSATLNYSYSANTSTFARTATISITGETYTVTQPGSAITFSPAFAIVPPLAGTGTVAFAQSPASAWTATSSANWLTVSPASGSGSQTLTYTFTANASVNARSATIIVAGQKFSVSQIGSTGNYTPWGTSAYGQIKSIAGNGNLIFGGDGGPASSAGLTYPEGATVDLNGNILIADYGNDRLRVVNAATGVISTMAGIGNFGLNGDGGPANAAGVTPTGVALDLNGNVFLSDWLTRIRRIDAVTDIITTIAGTGVAGYSGDGGPATSAEISIPGLLTVNALGDIYVPDETNSVIRKISGGIISTFAGVYPGGFSGDGGPASAALLNRPTGVAFDPAGNLLIADSNNNRVRRVDAVTGKISTIAGTGASSSGGDGGLATAASLNRPWGLVVDTAGNVFVSEQYGNRVRRIDSRTGFISTAAGGTNYGGGGDGGPATSAGLYQPQGISLDAEGNLIIADTSDNRVRFVDFSSPSVSFSASSAQYSSAAGSGTLAVTLTAGGPYWMASSNAAWLTLTSSSGSGSGSVSYSYTANTSVLPRSATITAYGQTFTVTQAGVTAALSAYSATVPATAGSGSVTLTVPSSSSWTASSTASWLTVTPASGTGGTTLTYSFTANSGTVARTATLLIAGKSFGVTQVGSTGNYTPWGASSYGWIRTIAGNGVSGDAGDGGPATSASLNGASAITVDANGNVFFTESTGNRVRRIDAGTQSITTVAGNGTPGYSGDGGPATSASLSQPGGIAVDAAGNLYIGDSGNSRVRRVDAVTGVITTYAGSGHFSYYGDAGLAINAGVSYPAGLTIDSAGNLYIADQYSNAVRRVDAVTGIISTVAGIGTSGFSGDGAIAVSAQLSSPVAVAIDNAGNVFVADQGNERIRRVDAVTGIISTVAGNGGSSVAAGGPATASGLNPASLAIDRSGNLFTEGGSRILRIDGSTGTIASIAGGLTTGFAGDGGPAVSALLASPLGLATDSAGDVYIVDAGNNRIRLIDYASPNATLAATSASVPANAGTGSVSFTLTPAAAPWTATSSAPWLTVSPAAGSGSGALSYSYAANGNFAARSATISIYNQTYTVTQAGASATVSPAINTVSSVAGSGTLTLTISGAAAWTASSTAPWLTVSPASGTTSSTLTYSFTANTAAPSRTATLTIAGRPVTVTQLGNTGNYTSWGSTAYGQIRTIAGNGSAGLSGDLGPATSAAMNYPFAVALDGNGNVYIADYSNNRIRRVDSSTGTITTAAGTGTGIGGYSGDSGLATAALLNGPQGIAADALGNLFIADSNNHRVRRVDAVTGVITTFAGTGTSGYSGDGGPATSAQIGSPLGLVLDSNGDLFISDLQNSVVRRVDAVSGVITTYAGTGVRAFGGDGSLATSAQIAAPGALAVDGSDNLFIADAGNIRVRRVDAVSKTISTVAGNGTYTAQDGVAATSSGFDALGGLAADPQGNLYIADYYSYSVRRVDVSSGLVTTVAGSGGSGFAGDGGPAALAKLQSANGLAADKYGNLFVADTSNERIRFIDYSSPRVTLASATASVPSNSGTGTVNFTLNPSTAIWAAASSAPWLTLTASSGTGGGALTFSYSANPGVPARSATVTLYGQVFTVTQAGSTASVSPSSATVTAAAGSGSVTLTLSSGASWTATSGASWLTVTPASGSAGGTLTYTFTANSGSAARMGALTIAGKQVSILQLGSTGAWTPFGTTAYGQIRTIAGTGNNAYTGDGGPAVFASASPVTSTVDASGNVYFVDADSSSIRRLDASSGIVTTAAGTGTGGSGPDNVQATASALFPNAVALDAQGNLFIADGTNRIRRVDAVTGIITTVAGNGNAVSAGDGGPALSASVYNPAGITVDGSGNLFIAESQKIRRVDAGTGLISTVAGTGTGGYSGDGGPATAAALYIPSNVAVDSSGNLFIADYGNDRIRRVDAVTGIISTIAGTGNYAFGGDGGLATAASLAGPTQIALDSAGNLFIADSSNNRIRRIDAVSGIITTAAGSGTSGFSGDGGPATLAALRGPTGVAVDSFGNLFISDRANYRIRFVDLSTPRVALSSSSGAAAAAAGTGSFNFTVSPAGAVWTATSSAPWLTLTASSGSGSGTVNYAYTATNSLSPRVATISIYGQSFTLTQAAATATLSAASATVSATAGSGTASLTTTPAAAWTASSSASWLTVSPASGSGSATVTYQYTANASNNARSAVLTIGGQTVSVLQTGASGAYTPWGTTANASITTIAGTGGTGFSGDFGPARSAQLNGPFGTAIDANGNVFIADTSNNRIRRVDAVSGVITTFAGTGNAGYYGDSGQALFAQLAGPRRIAFDASGNLFVADTGNNRIRRIDAVTGIITTVAGGGFLAPGDGGPATFAILNSPSGIAVDALGNIYIADTGNNRIRVVNFGTGVISTLAGNSPTGGYAGDGGPATSAQLNFPRGVALDGSGNVYIPDLGSNRIRRVDAVTGLISTVAGTGSNGFGGDGAAATAAQLNAPWDVAADKGGNLFIADNLNQRVRRVDAGTHNISTVAGTGTAGSTGDGGAATSAQLNSPAGVTLDRQGNLYIAESVNQRVRFVDFTTPVPTPPAGGGGGGGFFPPPVSTLSAAPAQLTFNVTPGAAPSSQTFTLTSTAGPAAYQTNAVLNSGTGWLSVSPASGSTDTQGTVTVTVNPGSLAIGTYTGTVGISAGTSIASVAVTLNVAGQLSAAPAALSFTYAQGDPATPLPLSLSVLSSPAGAVYTAAASTSGGGNWLSAGAGGTAPSAIPVSVNVGGLAAGSYTGTVTVSSSSAGSVSVPVTLTVTSATPHIAVSPASKTLSAMQGGGMVTGQITVSNTGGGALNFTAQAASDSGNWLTLTGGASGTASASSPASVAFSIDPSSLTPGLYTGTVTVTDSGSGAGGTATLLLSVSAAGPSLQLSQSGMVFSTLAGGLAPPPQTFTVFNAGAGALNWTVNTSVLPNPLSSSNWLTATAGASGAVNVAANSAGLPAGQYYGSVNIVAAGATNSPQTVSVLLNVGAASQSGGGVSISTGGLLLTGAAGSGPVRQQIGLFSPGSAPIAYTATASAGWLSVTPASGNLTQGSTALTVAADFTGLAAGAQNGSIRISLANGTAFNIDVVAFATRLQAHASTGCAAGKPSSVIYVFRSPADQAVLTVGTPQDIQVQLLDDCGNAIAQSAGGSAQVLAGSATLDLHDTGGGVWEATWIPSAVAAQVKLQVTASENGATLASVPGGITVSVTAAGAGSAPRATGIANAAAGAQAPAQVVGSGSYIAVYGSGLSGSGATVATSAPFPTMLNGTQVLLGGVALPLYYASPTQINALVPSTLNVNASYPFIVVNGSAQSVPVAVTVVAFQPGLYSSNASGSGQGAVEIAGTPLLAAPASSGSRPAVRGQDILALFGTGLGTVLGPNGESAPASGTAASGTLVYRTTAKVTATVGGVDAPVLFSGLTPTLVSLYQINVSVPSGAPAGDAVPVIVTVTDPAGKVIQSNTVTVAIQ